MSKSIKKIADLVRELEVKRTELIEHMLTERHYAVGSVSLVRRKCGKPNCHCAEGEGHSQTLFLFKGEGGRRICKLVRNDDADYMAEVGDNYREFRARLRELRAMQKRVEEKLMAILQRRAVTYD